MPKEKVPNKLMDELDEIQFKKWYADVSEKYGLHPNPDHPAHQYDYRGAYKSGIREPKYQEEHKQYRWPDEFKMKGYNKP